MSTLNIIPRPSEERGNADHGWLKSFHTFDFASYQDSGHDKYGSLRVINEDRVVPGKGFGTHSHSEFEIFSYIVKGQLEHKDSMGNTEILKRGDIQLTSAGTGISHSEKTYGSEEVHFLQIWSIPSVQKLTPKYFTRHFTDEEKKDKWVRVVASINDSGVTATREGDGPAPVQSPLSLFATLLSPSSTLSHTFHANSKPSLTKRKAYIHVVQTSGYNTGKSSGASVKIEGSGGSEAVLNEGDAAYLVGETGEDLKVTNVGDKVAEILLFDLE